jgi:hypothetical protein
MPLGRHFEIADDKRPSGVGNRTYGLVAAHSAVSNYFVGRNARRNSHFCPKEPTALDGPALY